MEYKKNKYKNKNKIFVEIDKNLFNFESFDNLIYKTKNQLFQIIPSFNFVKSILKILMNTESELPKIIYFEFSKKYLINKNIKEKFIEILPDLKKIYLKCKHEKYLENLNEKKIVTIIRQLIRPYNYSIKTKEKYDNGKKYLLYILKINNISEMEKIGNIINFD
jgi:hypothetical protein